MDFFEHQDRARRNTGLLIIYFVIAVALIIAAVYLAVAGVLFYGQSHDSLGRPNQTLWYPELFGMVTLATIVIVAMGSLYKMAELSGGGEVVARMLGGRFVAPNTLDLRERVLLNVVEEMALASGVSVPPVYLLDHEDAINAFAAGTTPQNAVIGVSRGSIETLKRDELQGVIAHEFSHILNGDMRLNIRLIGVLNGILLIAMIGYFLMRTQSGSSYDRSSNEKRGGSPLPLLGFLLYIIGYVGIFFGHLIKSAVSRQREFLADASAVQFTRFPDGIAGALKKIGGLMQGSHLQTANAEEASHMFFGNALRSSFLQFLSTHPPLPERIRRIDPQFDGKFPVTREIAFSAQDVIDPHTLASRLASPESVHLQAAAGAERVAFQPAAAVAQIGSPNTEHLEYAASLVNSLPPLLSSEVRDPLGAVATIYALLLDDDEPPVREAQLAYLASKPDPRANQEMLRLISTVATLQPEVKLPLVAMVLPALHSLAPQQLDAFRSDVTFLIRADQKVSLFEYAVHRMIQKRLLPRLERKSAREVRTTRLEPLLPACSGLLSGLAYAGTRNDQEAVCAFEQAVNTLPIDRARVCLLPRAESSLKVIDESLDQFAAASPDLKKRIITACAECIGADGRVTVEEAELLRVISDALDCPMPPLLKK